MQKEFQKDVHLVKPVFYGGENCSPGHIFGPAVRRVYLLHYVISGTGCYTVGKQKYIIREGEAFFIRPGEITVYQADYHNPWSYIWVGFQSDAIEFQTIPYHIKKKELQNVMDPYKDAETVFELSEMHATALTWSVAAALIEPAYRKESEIDYVKRAMQIIAQRYTGELTISGIASMLSIDRSYFSNLFKRKTGVSPQQYLMEYRLSQAIDLLEEGTYSITVIARSVGFSDVFSFSRNFKKKYNVSPTKYMKQIDSTIDRIRKIKKPY